MVQLLLRTEALKFYYTAEAVAASRDILSLSVVPTRNRVTRKRCENVTGRDRRQDGLLAENTIA
jgi:hypothetical protein